ncbi:hypothetical protein Dsin_023270 [Dipteronia sinensis]|uniref:Uncharacterized protein n=1 Tax=Dipteronia sinensis TaxID=43782 RepID=A0AAE0E0I7_9ROSI|nr:hypothetical protein Dsin_023270 [Dipteronia sinensis]
MASKSKKKATSRSSGTEGCASRRSWIRIYKQQQITGDGAVCWQKEIEIQRRREEMLEKNLRSVRCIERALKKIKTLETKEDIFERNMRFVENFKITGSLRFE